jgi:hypothetical protein
VSFSWDFVTGLASPRSRRELFIHEMFHRVQPDLGLMQLAAANEHVDAMDGRYWLRLEWRALARALQESGAARVDAVRDALAFRQARRALYAGSAEDERKVEITEGLPNYTGIVVAASSPADAIASAVDLLLGTAGIPDSVVRTFPSTTIPAYGLLNLRAGFKGDDRWEAFVWVKNAADEKYFQYISGLVGNTGALTGNPGDPRTVGVTLKASY